MRPLRHILLIGALTAPAGLHAQGPPSAQATAITTAPTIDGRLDEAEKGATPAAEGAEEFQQRFDFPTRRHTIDGVRPAANGPGRAL